MRRVRVTSRSLPPLGLMIQMSSKPAVTFLKAIVPFLPGKAASAFGAAARTAIRAVRTMRALTAQPSLDWAGGRERRVAGGEAAASAVAERGAHARLEIVGCKHRIDVAGGDVQG